jgi:hypothetical protein
LIFNEDPIAGKKTHPAWNLDLISTLLELDLFDVDRL